MIKLIRPHACDRLVTPSITTYNSALSARHSIDNFGVRGVLLPKLSLADRYERLVRYFVAFAEQL